MAGKVQKQVKEIKSSLSFRLTVEDHELLRKVAEVYGLSQTETLIQAVYCLASKAGLVKWE